MLLDCKPNAAQRGAVVEHYCQYSSVGQQQDMNAVPVIFMKQDAVLRLSNQAGKTVVKRDVLRGYSRHLRDSQMSFLALGCYHFTLSIADKGKLGSRVIHETAKDLRDPGHFLLQQGGTLARLTTGAQPARRASVMIQPADTVTRAGIGCI
jgi:hypothetical protein